MTLQITDNTTGKTYIDRSGWHDLLDDNNVDYSCMEMLCTNGVMWCIEYDDARYKRCRFALYPPSRFQVSFEGMVSEEKVRKVLAEEYEQWNGKEINDNYSIARYQIEYALGAVKSIADALNINLSEEGSAK